MSLAANLQLFLSFWSIYPTSVHQTDHWHLAPFGHDHWVKAAKSPYNLACPSHLVALMSTTHLKESQSGVEEEWRKIGVPNTFARVHVVEGSVDISQRLSVGNELVDLQFPIHIVRHEIWKLCPAFDTSKRAPFPNAACNELES